MDKIFNKIMIVDGSYLLHRQLHQGNIFELRGPTGERTGGIFGFLRSLNKEILNCSEYFPIVVFDHGLAQRRTLADPHYKNAEERISNANKLITPEEIDNDYITQYRMQRNKLVNILSYFGIPAVMISGWEGDDLMYILTNMSEQSIVLTDDRDMLQLLSKNCVIRRPMADEFWDIDNFLESHSFEDIFDFVIYKAIKGDASDNIPGSCKGVGDSYVNALIKIIKRYSISRDNNEWADMSGYPCTENDMRELCKNLEVSYRKAFLNFDRDRFITNMELVDLNLVKPEDFIVDSIVSTIKNSSSHTDFFALMRTLGELDIKDVAVDTIIESVSNRYRNLMRG